MGFGSITLTNYLLSNKGGQIFPGMQLLLEFLGGCNYDTNQPNIPYKYPFNLILSTLILVCWTKKMTPTWVTTTSFGKCFAIVVNLGNWVNFTKDLLYFMMNTQSFRGMKEQDLITSNFLVCTRSLSHRNYVLIYLTSRLSSTWEIINVKITILSSDKIQISKCFSK